MFTELCLGLLGWNGGQRREGGIIDDLIMRKLLIVHCKICTSFALRCFCLQIYVHYLFLLVALLSCGQFCNEIM